MARIAGVWRADFLVRLPGKLWLASRPQRRWSATEKGGEEPPRFAFRSATGRRGSLRSATAPSPSSAQLPQKSASSRRKRLTRTTCRSPVVAASAGTPPSGQRGLRLRGALGIGVCLVSAPRSKERSRAGVEELLAGAPRRRRPRVGAPGEDRAHDVVVGRRLVRRARASRAASRRGPGPRRPSCPARRARRRAAAPATAAESVRRGPRRGHRASTATGRGDPPLFWPGTRLATFLGQKRVVRRRTAAPPRARPPPLPLSPRPTPRRP